jgi:hypothetical protein
MIELMVKTEKLDRELWEDHKVIVSEAFLESLKPAYEKRNNKVITIDEIRNNYINGKKTGNSMTVREVATIIGCSHETVRNYIRKLWPDLMQNGVTTCLTKAQVAVIDESIKKTTAENPADESTNSQEQFVGNLQSEEAILQDTAPGNLQKEAETYKKEANLQVSGVNNPQSKVKKSKVKESKVNGGGKISLQKPDVFPPEKNQPPPPQILELIISEVQKAGFIIDRKKALEFYHSGIDLSWYEGPYSFFAFAAQKARTGKYADKPPDEQRNLFNNAVASWENLRVEYPLWLKNRKREDVETANKEALKKAAAAKSAEIQKAKDAAPKVCECGGHLDDMLCCLKCEHVYTFDEDTMKYRRHKMNTLLLNHTKQKYAQKQAVGPPQDDIDF